MAARIFNQSAKFYQNNKKLHSTFEKNYRKTEFAVLTKMYYCSNLSNFRSGNGFLPKKFYNYTIQAIRFNNQ